MEIRPPVLDIKRVVDVTSYFLGELLTSNTHLDHLTFLLHPLIREYLLMIYCSLGKICNIIYASMSMDITRNESVRDDHDKITNLMLLQRYDVIPAPNYSSTYCLKFTIVLLMFHFGLSFFMLTSLAMLMILIVVVRYFHL